MIVVRSFLAFVLSSASFACVTVQSSAVATGPAAAPSTGPVSVLLSHDPQDAEELGIVEAHGSQPVKLESVLARFRESAASLGGDVARIDRFTTRYETVSELYTYDCSTTETRTETRIVSRTEPDGSTSTTTELVPVTETVSKTCSEFRDREVAILTLMGRAFRTVERRR